MIFTPIKRNEFLNEGVKMNFLSQILNVKEIVEKNNFELSKMDFDKINTNIGFKIINKFETESQIELEEDAKEMYSNYLTIDFQWSVRLNRTYYGAFTMLSLKQSLEYHDDIIRNYYDAVEYSDNYENPITVLEEVKNYYPIFSFCDGNAFCLDKRNSHIVFYDHSVFEFYDGHFNGKLIAANYNDLIERWSKVLFMEQFWGTNDSLNNNGINVSSAFFADFLKNLNN